MSHADPELFEIKMKTCKGILIAVMDTLAMMLSVLGFYFLATSHSLPEWFAANDWNPAAVVLAAFVSWCLTCLVARYSIHSLIRRPAEALMRRHVNKQIHALNGRSS